MGWIIAAAFCDFILLVNGFCCCATQSYDVDSFCVCMTSHYGTYRMQDVANDKPFERESQAGATVTTVGFLSAPGAQMSDLGYF
jgi:hypothetical protein